MKLEGSLLSPEEKEVLSFEIHMPIPAEIAPFSCAVKLVSRGSGKILVDNKVYGEDAFQALHAATTLIHCVSGWEAAMQPKKN